MPQIPFETSDGLPIEYTPEIPGTFEELTAIDVWDKQLGQALVDKLNANVMNRQSHKS